MHIIHHHLIVCTLYIVLTLQSEHVYVVSIAINPQNTSAHAYVYAHKHADHAHTPRSRYCSRARGDFCNPGITRRHTNTTYNTHTNKQNIINTPLPQTRRRR